MPLKVDDFLLSNATLLKMAEVTQKTKKAERGFALCYRDTKEIDPGREHIGGRWSISHKNCPPGQVAGNFHTHPVSDSSPSWGDGYSIVHGTCSRQKPWLGCRGGTDKRIRCETASRMPTTEETGKLKREWGRKMHTELEADPQMVELTKTIADFSIYDIPEMVKPPPIPKEPWKGRLERGELELVSEKEDVYTIYRRYRHKLTGEEYVLAIEKARPLPVP